MITKLKIPMMIGFDYLEYSCRITYYYYNKHLYLNSKHNIIDDIE